MLNSKNWKFIQKKNQGSTSTVRTITIFFLTHYFVNLKSNSTLLYNKGHNLLTSALPTKHTQLNEMYQREFFIQILLHKFNKTTMIAWLDSWKKEKMLTSDKNVPSKQVQVQEPKLALG